MASQSDTAVFSPGVVASGQDLRIGGVFVPPGTGSSISPVPFSGSTGTATRGNPSRSSSKWTSTAPPKKTKKDSNRQKRVLMLIGYALSTKG